jgi:hypothetical protein
MLWGDWKGLQRFGGQTDLALISANDAVAMGATLLNSTANLTFLRYEYRLQFSIFLASKHCMPYQPRLTLFTAVSTHKEISLITSGIIT